MNNLPKKSRGDSQTRTFKSGGGDFARHAQGWSGHRPQSHGSNNVQES